MADFSYMDSTKIKFHIDRLAIWKSGGEIPPIHLDVGISNRCQHRCKHCYLAHLKPNCEMLDDDVLMRFMANLGPAGVRSIFFAGSGEPTLHPKLAEAARTAKKGGVDCALATNGLKMPRHLSRKLIDSMSWIRYSMQGGTRETYAALHTDSILSYDIVTGNLKNLCDVRNQTNSPCKIGVMTCLMPGSEAEPPLLAKMAKSVGADYYTVRPPCTNPTRPLDCPVWDTNRLHDTLAKTEAVADDNFKVIVRWNLFNDQEVREYKKCLGLPFLAQTDGNGGVYACGVLVGNEDYCYGNLYEQPFKEIWESQRRRDVMYRLQNSGDFSACDNLCRMHNINKYLWDLHNPPQHANFI